VETILESAHRLGIATKVVDVRTSEDARMSPSPYGTFGLVYDGELLSYYPIFGNELEKLLEKRAKLEKDR
jgi:hypothetical protein